MLSTSNSPNTCGCFVKMQNDQSSCTVTINEEIQEPNPRAQKKNWRKWFQKSPLAAPFFKKKYYQKKNQKTTTQANYRFEKEKKNF